ncbi:hypothetical protein PybrP1_006817 [[Pythium] brassicae (nom. inval.)]|nr:hypothetical protein PybrP1_006817 [[Pythium] brassicae (nom. inval.)]
MGDDPAAAATRKTEVNPLKFIEQRVATTFPALVGPKFTAKYATEHNESCIKEFLESEDVLTLIFTGDNVVAAVKMPPSLARGKTVCFTKFHRTAITSKNVLTDLFVNEMTNNSVEYLEKLISEIYLPLFSNPANQEGWGEVASKEVVDKFHSYMASVSIISGATKGETCLPLPPVDGNATNLGTKISLLEGSIVIWTKQIKNVLKQDPEDLLKQGLHPTPDAEIEFWKLKAANLNSVFEQLQSKKVRKILTALDRSKSTYCTTFARLCKEVFTARIEANDNMKYLRTLEEWFVRLNNDEDFPSLTELFKPMLHIILLIWKNSKHYNTPARLVVLMREICNSLINQARKYLSGELIFQLIDQDEANVAVEQLKTTLQVCSAFKSTYFDYKATANAECPSNPWRIQGNALFVRLDSFLERCHDILDLTQTIVQFCKLSKIEVGGTKGKTLTLSVQQIHADFAEAVRMFKRVSSDIMDVGASKFDDNFYDFRCKIKELERRLGSVLTQGFDDCSTIFGRFKLLDSFEGLLNRPIIQDELEKKHVALVQSYGQDLKLVQELFLHCRDAPPMSWNLPPVAGALTWCRGLVERIEHPMKKLKELNQNVMEREEAKEVYKVYGTIVASLQEFENQKVEEWSRDVEASSQTKLKNPLLVRHPQTRCLRVNFDPALEKLLREIKYLRLLGVEVPPSALQISAKEETFRRFRGELMYIVDPYNAMIEGLHPLEEPLVRRHITNIDASVGRGVEELNWKSNGVDAFIDECRKAVEGAHEIVTSLKDNLSTIQDTLGAWNSPLLERQAKPVAVSEHERLHKSYIVQRTLKVREGATEIHRRLKQSSASIVGVNQAQWKAYVDYVNNIVVHGVARVICSSLEFLAKQLDPNGSSASAAAAAAVEVPRESGGGGGGGKGAASKADRLPMLEIKLDLIASRVQFNPSIGENNGKGLRDTIQVWINSFFTVATAVKRLDSDGGGTYLREMHADMTICMHLASISEYLQENEDMLVRFKTKYDSFAYLWEADMAADFHAFLATATFTSATGTDLLDLARFDAEISKYEQVAGEIESLTTPTDVGWLRVNSQPIKTAMLTWVSKWIYQYTTYLHTHVVNKLGSLHGFMDAVLRGLEEQVGEKNKEALMRVMTHIRDVRKQMDATSEVFEPLRAAVHLLKTHGINVEDTKIAGHAVQDYLEAAPMQWEGIVNKTFKKKEEILPLQMAEVDSIKEDLEAFYLDMRRFRSDFRATAPFSFQGAPADAYAQMNAFAARLHDKMKQARQFNELEELFELQVSKYQETVETLYELQQLKKCWDLKDLVLGTFDDWKSTLWSRIQTDAFETYTRAFLKQLKLEASEHQLIKSWQVYKDTEQLVKNMATVLPLINDLHSEAMQDRHWRALSLICQVKVIDPKDPKLCFADLLKLHLHAHVDDVGEIVETANKEQKIEKKLTMIEELWRRLTLEYVPHKDSGTFVVKPSEEVVESLESNQLELQTMVGMGKFVEFFKDRVLASQKTLGHVEEVLKEWVSVSKQWASLESIFLSSPDIRNQLPDDTRTFEAIDSNFKDLMKNAVVEPNVVAACSVESRLEALKEMTTMLEKCQKSLNEYLDKKKKIFPRFYFVSNVALLEILSNGNNPKKIMPFLGDCYDSLCDLVFEDGSPNTAHTMVAKDGETARLPRVFVMVGAVESWLNDLTEAMRVCIRKEMHDAIETAASWDVEKPRHQWLFDYPAQVVLNATQIYWTEETEMALEEFENGQEDSVKRYLSVCNQRLDQLITLVLGNLSSPDRCKIIALITLDVHSRDVVKRLVDEKVEGPLSFLWQQQLRFIWRQENYDVNVELRGKVVTVCKQHNLQHDDAFILKVCQLQELIDVRHSVMLLGPAGCAKTTTWQTLVKCWNLGKEKKMCDEIERTYLPGHFDKYVDTTCDLMRKGYKQVAPVRLINQVSTICYLLEGLLAHVPADKKTQDVIESVFVFCATWAFGGPLIVDKSIDYRKNFHELWCATFPSIKYPKDGLCFDYFYNFETNEFENWNSKVPRYVPASIGNGPADTPFSSIVVSTNDSVRIRFLIETLVSRQRPAILVGGSGTGKTTIIKNFLRDLDDDMLFSAINMNYYTDSFKLQQQLEAVIDKRSGRMFGPPATKKLVYFIDDLNLPYIETYGTQNALALLRQHLDYKTIFDRTDLGFRKEIVDVQYLSAMNPTAGSFIIDERLQRHYALFACMMPSREDLKTIYSSILKGHFQSAGFGAACAGSCDAFVAVSILLHEDIANRFLPSATKFVYNWNMRELSNVFQGLTRSKGDFFPTAAHFARLWVHECTRVFCDRLINDDDIIKFNDRIREIAKKTLPDVDHVALFNDHTPAAAGDDGSGGTGTTAINIFTTFATPVAGADSAYVAVDSMRQLNKVLVEQLDDYNSKYSMMNLELFDNAMEHVTRICRIIGNPGGNAMLIGVGGSGKQSLSRLAAHICGFEVRQLSVTSNFRIEDLKENLAEMFKVAGIQGLPLVFLITDSQIVNERFLVYINDMLSSGWIPDLFPKEDIDSLLGALRSEAKANGVPDTTDTLLDFLLLRIRLNFRIVLCFSPVGAVFRVRARRFPGLVNCTVIDWFHPWPRDALVRVATSFLDKVEDLGDAPLKRSLANHMADVHISVTDMSRRYFETQRRYNYVTPKSFLELISFYEILLKQKKEDIQRQITRLDDGLSTLRKTSADVAELQVDLKHTMLKVAEKQASTDQLLEQMGREKAGAEVQQEFATLEKHKAEAASAAAATLAAEAEKELSQAKPAMDAAAAAVDCLSKPAITELKSLPKPPAGVDNVTKACLILVEKEYKNHKWDRAKKMMNNAGAFLDALKEFRGEDIPEADIARIEPLIADPEFTAEKMAAKSSAAANICSWVVNIYTFNRIYVRVKPLMDSLEASRKKKEEAEEQLAKAMGQVAEVQKRLEALENTLRQATEEKLKVEQMKESCENRLVLAGKLVNGLASENERWGVEIEQLKHSGVMVVGNSLLAAAFVSYIGAFDQAVRKELWQLTWFPDLLSQHQWLRKMEAAIVNGHVVIIENIDEEIDATLDPVLSRAVYKKGSNLYLKLAGEEVQYDAGFFMYLQTKLSNPHYKPEIAAQCTLINFIATESGLEDQLLEKVVKKEQPELERQKQELVLAFQKFKIDLVELEDQLLERLANAPDDILSDVPLIESLEETKKKATEISISVRKNQETEVVINNTRELYRPVAAEGAMLYFLLTTLSAIDHMYRYSLDSFVTFFYNAIDRAPAAEKQGERVLNLRESLRITVFTWVSRGLFEAHKLIFLSQLTFNLMKRGILGDDARVQENYMQFLLRGPKKVAAGGGDSDAEPNPIDWLPNAQWGAVNALAALDEFQKMPQDLKEASSRFREWYNHVTPESEKLPLDWSGLDRTPFLKLLVVRCLRPDRMTVAVNEFVRHVLPNGSNYCDCDSALNSIQVMDNSYLDSTPTTPLYFILSPGADVVAGVDKLSVKYGFERGVSYHNVSMGQGQDVFAMDRLEVAHRNGHWVILNNIHLMPRWLVALEKKLDEFALEGSHKHFRLFLTSDPSNAIPIGVLNRCIKLTNEPPSGLKANLKRAFVSFPKEAIEEAEGKVKSILFGLCHFHAVLMERKMYGPLGYNMLYPFSLGDLRDSAICLQNYLESSAGGKIPWADLRYIFGEIMYGGHIVNDFDRLLATTYLEFYMRDELLDEMEMFPFVGDEKGPSFLCLAPSSYDKYLEHIETELKTDSPLAFGLHPNAEIDFRTTQSESLFRTLMELQPRDAAAGDAALSPTELARAALDLVLARVGEKKFECDDVARSLEEMGPYQNVFLQECETMNGLLAEIARSLTELQLGFAGELTMSDAMEAVQESLFLDRVPKSWEKLAFPSLRPLGSWLTNLEARLQQLDEWTQNPAEIPRVTWLAGLVNPQSFLTAIMQVTAQKNQWELDKLVVQTDVLKRKSGEIDAASRDGAYVHGLALMGARWDATNSTVDRSNPKEMFSPMPVVNCKAVAADKLDVKGAFLCPCYKTETRGPTYVFSAQLKTKSPPARWVLAGVALIMDVV